MIFFARVLRHLLPFPPKKIIFWAILAYLIVVIFMNKLEEFKNFAKNLPHLKELVKDKGMTWQELFERYDIYGPDDDVFNREKAIASSQEEKTTSTKTTKETKETKKDSQGLNSILDALSGFDAEKISDGLNGVKKILSVLSEVTRPEDKAPLSKRKMARNYQRNDD